MMALHLTRKARPMAEKSPSAPLPMAASDKHQAKVEQSGSDCFFFPDPYASFAICAHTHKKNTCKYMMNHTCTVYVYIYINIYI